MIVPPHWFVEQVTVETYAGSGAYGDSYAAAVTVLGHIGGGRRLRQSTTADEIVSEQRLMIPNPAYLADGSGTVDPAALLTAESRVTSGAVVATVVEVRVHKAPGSDAVVYVSGGLG